MGIQGLLSFLDKASRPVNVSEFSGCTVAIDSYCWLHKGAFSCAEKLARGEKTDQYVNYCMKFVNMLLSHNIKPIMVFDGRHLPAKAETEKKRRELRESNRKKAAELLRLEKESEARSLIQRCVDVTHEMALALIKQCRSQGVDCIVAPFEADAQLAFLNINGFAHVVITEDSDLMLFGCKLVLFKMDLYGNGVLIEQSKIPLSMKVHPNQFSMDKFRYMCILSGCDYLKSLPGIGLAKACKFIKKTQDDNISRALTRMGAYLNMANLEVTQDYREKFLQADAMFKYQPVFDPVKRRVVPLNPLPPGVDSPLVNLLDEETSYQLALGNLNPFSLERVDSWDPDQPQSIRTNSWKSNVHKHKSIWSHDYKIPAPLPAKRDPRDVKHPSTKGKTVVQPVSVLTDKIAALPQKSADMESELARLRESFSAKPPPAKKQCIQNEEENEVYSCDSGIVTDIEEKSYSEEKGDSLQVIIETPEKTETNRDNDDLTVEDILSDDRSPILSQKAWRNPFSASKGRQETARRSLGGALDMFSKLKKTQVEAACVVQSRYFASDGAPSPVANSKPEEKSSNTTDDKKDTDLNKTLFEIISSPSPKKKKSLISVNTVSASPGKSVFFISDMEESEEKNEMSSPKRSLSKFSASPRKRIFATPSNENNQSVVEDKMASPKGQSFLKILEDVSKEIKDDTPKSETPKRKKLGSSSFKWSQPLLDCPDKGNKDLSLLGLYKPNTKQRLPAFSSKSPKGPSKKGSTLSPKKKASLPDKATFKKKSTDSNQGQSTLLKMFAFQPKAKLTTQ